MSKNILSEVINFNQGNIRQRDFNTKLYYQYLFLNVLLKTPKGEVSFTHQKVDDKMIHLLSSKYQKKAKKQSSQMKSLNGFENSLRNFNIVKHSFLKQKSPLFHLTDFFPYRKSFLCYWLLPFVGFVYTVSFNSKQNLNMNPTLLSQFETSFQNYNRTKFNLVNTQENAFSMNRISLQKNESLLLKEFLIRNLNTDLSETEIQKYCSLYLSALDNYTKNEVLSENFIPAKLASNNNTILNNWNNVLKKVVRKSIQSYSGHFITKGTGETLQKYPFFFTEKENNMSTVYEHPLESNSQFNKSVRLQLDNSPFKNQTLYFSQKNFPVKVSFFSHSFDISNRVKTEKMKVSKSSNSMISYMQAAKLLDQFHKKQLFAYSEKQNSKEKVQEKWFVNKFNTASSLNLKTLELYEKFFSYDHFKSQPNQPLFSSIFINKLKTDDSLLKKRTEFQTVLEGNKVDTSISKRTNSKENLENVTKLNVQNYSKLYKDQLYKLLFDSLGSLNGEMDNQKNLTMVYQHFEDVKKYTNVKTVKLIHPILMSTEMQQSEQFKKPLSVLTNSFENQFLFKGDEQNFISQMGDETRFQTVNENQTLFKSYEKNPKKSSFQKNMYTNDFIDYSNFLTGYISKLKDYLMYSRFKNETLNTHKDSFKESHIEENTELVLSSVNNVNKILSPELKEKSLLVKAPLLSLNTHPYDVSGKIDKVLRAYFSIKNSRKEMKTQNEKDKNKSLSSPKIQGSLNKMSKAYLNILADKLSKKLIKINSLKVDSRQFKKGNTKKSALSLIPLNKIQLNSKLVPGFAHHFNQLRKKNNINRVKISSVHKQFILNKSVELKFLMSLPPNLNLEKRNRKTKLTVLRGLANNRLFLNLRNASNVTNKKILNSQYKIADELKKDMGKSKITEYLLKNLLNENTKSPFLTDSSHSESDRMRKYLKKKRRIKKLKKETRQRKKRKRFYPRPLWMRYRLYSNFLKKRYYKSPVNKNFVNLNTSNLTSFRDIQTLNESKTFYTVSRPVLGELKRVLWKSYWLRSNLNPYLTKVKTYLNSVKESKQSWELYHNFKSFIFHFLGFNNYAETLNQENLWINSYSQGTDKQNSPQLISNFTQNNMQVFMNLAEYNRNSYERMQQFISQIRENLTLNGNIKIRASHIGYLPFKDKRGITVRKNEDFWVKLGKTLTFETQQSSVLQSTSKLRLYWAFSKTSYGFFKDNHSRKNRWAATKQREQTKNNKTKKIYRNMKTQLQILLNERFPLLTSEGLTDFLIKEKFAKFNINPGSIFESPQNGNELEMSASNVLNFNKNINKLLQKALEKSRQKEEKIGIFKSADHLLTNNQPSITNGLTKVTMKKNTYLSSSLDKMQNEKNKKQYIIEKMLGFESDALSNHPMNKPHDRPFYRRFSFERNNIKNHLTTKSSYWWTNSLPFDSVLGEKNGIKQTEQISKHNIQIRNESNSIYLISSLLFHFCAILSILSISQIRGFMKFVLIGVSKIYKIGIGLMYSLPFQHNDKTTKMSENVGMNFKLKMNEHILSQMKHSNNLKMNTKKNKTRAHRLGDIFKGYDANSQISVRNEFPQSVSSGNLQERNRSLLKNLLFNKNKLTEKKRKYSDLNNSNFVSANLFNLTADETKNEKKLTQHLSLDSNNFEYFKYLTFLNNLKQLISFIQGKNNMNFIRKRNNKTTQPTLNSVTQYQKNTQFSDNLNLLNKKIYLLIRYSIKKPIYYYKFNFTKTKNIVQNKDSKGMALKSLNPNETALNYCFAKLTLSCLVGLNSISKQYYNVYFKASAVLKDIKINIFEKCLRSVYTFLEKPGEQIVDWVAYMFLVEWASDISNTIPENFDIYIGSTTQKFNRILFFENLNFPFILSNAFLLNSVVKNSKMADTNNLQVSLNQLSLLNLVTPFIHRRVNHLYDILLMQFYQPDTDLITRQKKGILFWDIWGDFLVQTAEESNINISELTSVKEEQIKLLEKCENSFSASFGNTKNIMNRFDNNVEKGTENFKKSGLKAQLKNPLIAKLKGLKLDKSEIFSSTLFSNSSVTNSKVNGDLGDIRLGWGAQQFLSYQGKDTELFIDLHPRASLGMVSLLKSNESVQQPIGTLICQIYSGLLSKQISKNILVVGSSGIEKTLLVQAIAGETELKIITDNAYRYAMVYRGVAVGIKLLRDVFDSLVATGPPCLFLIEDIHAIGEKRPLLISDDENLSKKDGGSQEIHEKNQVFYQLSKHVITHYKKPYKGDFSLLIPTNHFCFDLFLVGLNNLSNTTLNKNNKTNYNKKQIVSPKISIEKDNTLTGSTSMTETNRKFSNRNIANLNAYKKLPSRLLIKSSELLSPPASSPFSFLTLVDSKKFKPLKTVLEMPWSGLPGEQLAQVSKASYSIRVKVALLADMAISSLSVKLDMITDLLVIIDSVKGNRGFVVFATTHVPHILDPALRRPGRLDETISLGLAPTLFSRWEILKSSFSSLNPTVNPSFQGVSLQNTVDFSYFNKNLSNQYSVLQIQTNLFNFISNKTLPMSTSLVKRNSQNKHYSNTRRISGIFSNQVYTESLLPSIKKYVEKQVMNNLAKTNVQQSISSQSNDIYLTQHHLSSSEKHKITRKILSQTYFTASVLLVMNASHSKFTFSRSNIDTQNQAEINTSLNATKKRSIHSRKALLSAREFFELTPHFFNENSRIINLYGSPKELKNHLVHLISGKLGEMILFSKSSQLNDLKVLIKNISKHTTSTELLKTNKNGNTTYSTFLMSNGMSTYSSVGLSNTWQAVTSLVLSYIHKRYIYHKNLVVPKLLNFTNYSSIYEYPSPPATNILLPAKRYENYKRSFSYFASKRKTSISIMEKINLHQQQRLVKRLYRYPVQESFKSEILENKFTTFTNASMMIGGYDAILQKPTSSNWFLKNRIFMRHKNYLTNQWWNGQLPEHNKETTFLSDIDWRYTFIAPMNSTRLDNNLDILLAEKTLKNSGKNETESSSKTPGGGTRYLNYADPRDILLDFPDADQHYNPRNRRWLLTKGSYNNWFDFEKTIHSEIYSHFIFDSFVKAYNIFEHNREILDFYAFYMLKNPSTTSKTESCLKLYQRMFS